MAKDGAPPKTGVCIAFKSKFQLEQYEIISLCLFKITYFQLGTWNSVRVL